MIIADDRNGMNVNKSSSSNIGTSTPYGNNASASTGNDQYYQQSPNYGAHQARNYQQPYGWSQSPQQNQYHANSQQQQQPQHQAPPPPPPAPQQHASQEGFVRTVPIVFEGTGSPINRTSETGSAPAGSNKPRPEPLNKESFAQNQPIPSDQPIPCPPPSSHNQQQPEQQHSGK